MKNKNYLVIIAIIMIVMLACNTIAQPSAPAATPAPSPTFSPVPLRPPTITPTSLPPLDFYFTNAFDPHGGTIYKVENGQISEYFRRPGGSMLYCFAFGPDGTLYLVNINSFHLLKVRDGKEIQVFTHNDYIRDVAFDSNGTLYFSEDHGSDKDGKIFTLDGTTAKLFYTVKLSEVDGFWGGTFNFDQDDTLWLSSGNTVPSHLYKVKNDVPSKVFTFEYEDMYGFYFTPGGHLVVANWASNVYRLLAPDFKTRETISIPGVGHLADVAPLTP